MKTSTITARLDDAFDRGLDQACTCTGRTRSNFAHDALRRRLALLRLERVRGRALPLAESQVSSPTTPSSRRVVKVTSPYYRSW
jgi:hypothetical protein